MVKKKETKEILSIKGFLTWDGNTMMPKPGTVKFKIAGAPQLLQDLLSISKAALPGVTNVHHLEGEIMLVIREKDPAAASREYDADVAEKQAIAEKPLILKRERKKPLKRKAGKAEEPAVFLKQILLSRPSLST